MFVFLKMVLEKRTEKCVIQITQKSKNKKKNKSKNKIKLK